MNRQSHHLRGPPPKNLISPQGPPLAGTNASYIDEASQGNRPGTQDHVRLHAHGLVETTNRDGDATAATSMEHHRARALKVSPRYNKHLELHSRGREPSWTKNTLGT